MKKWFCWQITDSLRAEHMPGDDVLYLYDESGGRMPLATLTKAEFEAFCSLKHELLWKDEESQTTDPYREEYFPI